MTQEDLAEKLEVSRQAVSKWELEASVPSPENLELLGEVLGITFPAPEETAPEETPPSSSQPPFWNWKRLVLLVLGVLIVSALLSIVMFKALRADTPQYAEPHITGIYFFNEDAALLRPDLGDGWNSFTAGERVLLMVAFEDGGEHSVNAVSLFLTPSGTGTLEYRKQVAVQAAGEGRDFALFAWDIPEDLMGHLDIVLECGDDCRITETLNVTAPRFPRPADIPGILAVSPGEIETAAGDIGQYVLEVFGVPSEEVAWTSSNPDAAQVDSGGRVSIEGAGEAVITASWEDQTAVCLVRVLPEIAGTEGSMDLPEDEPRGTSEPIPPSYESRKIQ